VPSAEQQVDDHESNNEAHATTTVVADTGPHIVTAAAKYYQKNDEDDEERHARSLARHETVCPVDSKAKKKKAVHFVCLTLLVHILNCCGASHTEKPSPFRGGLWVFSE
jgi:hypothetical protein